MSQSDFICPFFMMISPLPNDGSQVKQLIQYFKLASLNKCRFQLNFSKKSGAKIVFKKRSVATQSLRRPTTKMAKRVSCGLDFVSPADITNALQIATESKYYFFFSAARN